MKRWGRKKTIFGAIALVYFICLYAWVLIAQKSVPHWLNVCLSIIAGILAMIFLNMPSAKPKKPTALEECKKIAIKGIELTEEEERYAKASHNSLFKKGR